MQRGESCAGDLEDNRRWGQVLRGRLTDGSKASRTRGRSTAARRGRERRARRHAPQIRLGAYRRSPSAQGCTRDTRAVQRRTCPGKCAQSRRQTPDSSNATSAVAGDTENDSNDLNTSTQLHCAIDSACDCKTTSASSYMPRSRPHSILLPSAAAPPATFLPPRQQLNELLDQRVPDRGAAPSTVGKTSRNVMNNTI